MYNGTPLGGTTRGTLEGYPGRVLSGSQGDPSNPQRFRTHHPPTFTGGGDPMVADHWFMQNEKVLEAMEITSDATRIRLTAFYLENEA